MSISTASEAAQVANTRRSWISWMANWLTWCPTSLQALREAEAKILKHLKSPYEDRFVEISCNNSIRTLSTKVEQKKEKSPLVMVHGFGSGIGLWVKNLDAFAKDRPVYAFDVLGFGRSSRPKFHNKAHVAEKQFVESIEEWRQEMGLNKFILLGHSLGGYLVTAYAMSYPEKVKHLILVDPWGFAERPGTGSTTTVPFWIRAVVFLIQPFNPLAVLRAAGPWGPNLVQKFRPDFKHRFKEMDEEAVYDYIYHCNAQRPSGETAFRCMTQSVGWAKNPMVSRITNLDENIPITMLYGSRSWISSDTGFQVKYIRNTSHVDVHVIRGSGHHVYSERPDEFNRLVLSACSLADQPLTAEEDTLPELRFTEAPQKPLRRTESAVTMKDDPPRISVVLD